MPSDKPKSTKKAEEGSDVPPRGKKIDKSTGEKKKKVHHRVDTVTNNRIRKEQQSRVHIIPNAPLGRIVRRLILLKGGPSFRVTKGMLDYSAYAGETYLVNLLSNATILAKHANRKTVMIGDFEALSRVSKYALAPASPSILKLPYTVPASAVI